MSETQTNTEDECYRIAEHMLNNGLEELIRLHFTRIKPYIDPNAEGLYYIPDKPDAPNDAKMSFELKGKLLAAEAELLPFLDKLVDAAIYFNIEEATLIVGWTDYYITD